MTTRDDARTNSLRHPGRHDVVTDLSFDAHEIASPNIELRGVCRVNPERIRVRDLVEPLCIRAARVNLHCETKRRDQDRLSFLEIVFVNVTLEVSRNREFGPTPVAQR